MAGALRPGDLASCDVLLYRGRGWISKAIRFFDGAEVSHAGLYLGKGAVAEALSSGVVRRDLETSIAGAERLLVRRLDPAPRSLRPVHAYAVAVVADGERYAYEQIILLAFLCLARRLVPTPTLQRFVRGVLDRAAEQVARLFDAGREPMICSEFVYRSYDEADPARDDVYAIDIPTFAHRLRTRSVRDSARAVVPGRGRGIHIDSILARTLAARTKPARTTTTRPRAAARRRHTVTDAQLEALFEKHMVEQRAVASRRAPRGGTTPSPELRAAIERFALVWSAATRFDTKKSRTRGAPSIDVAFDALHETVADFVTPGDLLRSPSLRTRGALEIRARTPVRSPARRSPAPRRRARAAPAKPVPPPRRDDDGGTWTLAEVEAVLFDIVTELTPGLDRDVVEWATRFGRDLGWDTWYTLRVIVPVRERLHETLPAAVAKRLTSVGQLVDAVWSRMEELE
jgi:acyl carrier protein